MPSLDGRGRSVCCIPHVDGNIIDSTATAVGVGKHHRNGCQYEYIGANHRTFNSGSSGGTDDGPNMTIQSGQHGRHAIASRNLKAGSIVIQCLPLSHSILVPPGTPMVDDDGDDNCDGQRRRCARCFFQEGDEDISRARRQKFGRCSKCRVAYYCSRSCQALDWNEQHKLECQYYVKRRKQLPTSRYASSPEEDSIPILLRTFNVLKFLRGKSDVSTKDVGIVQNDETNVRQVDVAVSCGPCHFSTLMVSDHTTGPAFIHPPMSLARDLMEKLAKKESTKTKSQATVDILGYESDCANNQTTDQAIHRTLNAFQKNNFGIVNALHSPIGEGVYPCAALLNHSCSPNCILRYKVANSAREQQYHPPILQIVACRDIVSGEELCHSYVDLSLCTQERQSRLLETHGFVCECIRCKKGGCAIELPKNHEEWELWPLKNGFRTHGGHNIDIPHPTLVKVDLDDAMGRCHGLSETEQEHIVRQSRILQQKANQCMAEGDATGEILNLRKATELFTTRRDGGRTWYSPFNGQLYSVRCSYLSALLANGQIHQAVDQCEHIVSFLEVAFSHVEHHPLLGLQLYTLGDLYAAAATMEDGRLTNKAKCSFQQKSRLAYAWAKQVMMVSHGATDPMVQTLDDNLASTG